MNTALFESIKNSLEEIKINVSNSYEGSMAYEMDINDTADGLDSLIESYTELQENVESNINVSESLEYENMSFFCTCCSEKISPLIEGVRSLRSKIRSVSSEAYSALKSEYDSALGSIERYLGKANTALQNYMSTVSKLHSLADDDPNRRIYESQKRNYESSFNSAVSSAAPLIKKMNKLLDEGLKRA